MSNSPEEPGEYDAALDMLEKEYAAARKRMADAEQRVDANKRNLEAAESVLSVETKIVAELVAALRLLTGGSRP